ncbi:S8 family serine peptidase [Mangrovivirga sp. M17]|uniref:S8 family serine peptidase n=1 Tax=Mangrovivirga halotolerans TaxID=2993936 RepID=A0ABT3RQH1_9BACT|nr:S8 family serine peptidase [Mangrovivirga halotolerans]MCX2743832.1 S8 family serine peptidase [Mangrovivirga halotolerans]
MNRLTIIVLVFFTFLGTFPLDAQISGDSESVVSGKVRIKFKESAFANQQNMRLAPSNENTDEVGIQSVDDVSKVVGITRIKRVFPFSPKFEAKHRKYNLHLWYEVEFDSSQSPGEVIKQYESLAEIDIVKPVYKKTRIDADKKPVFFDSESFRNDKSTAVMAQQNFNDPLISDQWHYESEDRYGEESSDIDLFEAWDITTGSSDIVVAIVDEGVDFNHEDLKDNMWVNEAELYGEEGVDDDQNGYVDDIYGTNFVVYGPITPGNHGTHVAGTVGAVSNNGLGVAGVAGGDGTGNGVKLMSTQVFDARNNGGLNFAEAIVYGADNGAVISQNSWGYNRDGFYEPEVLEAIRYFIAEAGQYEGSPMQGGILFFATGNSAIESIRYPGAFEEVVAVSATGPTGFPAPYTNYGDWVDISAPGGDMTNFDQEGGVLSTLVGDQYGYLEGTSMACPHVSGVAALVLSKFGGDGFTPDDLRRIIVNSTNPFRFQHNNKYGKGILNAVKALVDDNRIPPNPIADLIASEIFHNEIRLEWTVPDDEDGFSPTNYHLSISNAPITAANFDNNAVFLIDNNKATGEKFNISISGFIKQTDYWFAVKSADQFENISEISNVLKVTTSSEPHFKSSTDRVQVAINVNESPLANVPITFSNISEGIIYWQTLISNETYFREPASSSAASSELYYNEGLAETASDIGNGIEFDPVRYLTEEEASANTFSTQKHWENDDTEFVAGLSYENGNPPAILAGSGNTQAGFIFATRFDIPYDYSFNLTHIEVALLPETNEYPILVEIKKGSRDDVTSAETVYMQEYYADTTNVFKYYRIPLYKPQKFLDNESFWVVLHYPKEMLTPMVMQFEGGEFNDRFIMSRDNGRTYRWAQELLFRPITPMLRVFSTGENGSFVFLDPNEGEIPQFSSQDVNITVDANALTNGNHLASIGILTNDIHKPIANIELKLHVQGQVPELNNSEIFEYEGFNNVDNDYSLLIENSGYGDLDIYGYSYSSTGITTTLSDTVTVGALEDVDFDFTYKPSTTGLINDKLILKTNIGDVPFSLRIISQNEPSMALSLASSNINVEYGSKAEISLTVTNSSAEPVVLDYDLEHYSLVKKQAGILAKKLTYSIKTSEDADGPSTGKWDDISEIGTQVDNQEIYNGVPVGFSFPFFDQQLDIIRPNNLGQINVLNYRAMVPLRIDVKPLGISEFRYFSFGDRLVLSYVCDLKYNGPSGYAAYGEQVEYQIALYRDGTVEYRYKDVTDLLPEDRYRINMVGIETKDTLIVKDYDDPAMLTNGYVVSFVPNRTVSMISETNTLNGSLPSGASKTVTLYAEPESFGLNAGTYNEYIHVYNNTSAGADSIPITINVTGCVDVSVQDSLNFNDVVILGQSDTRFLIIENQCAEKITLNSVVNNIPEFYPVNVNFPLTINGNSKELVPVEFTPAASSEYTGKLTFSFDDLSTHEVIVTGNGLSDAEYTFDLQTPVSVSLKGGEKTTVPFTLTNTGNDKELNFIFKNGTYSSIADLDSGRAIGSNGEGLIGEYGYSVDISDSTKIFHKWQPLDQDKNKVELNDNGNLKIDLPFQFPFYGKKYSSIWISKNGYIAVEDPENEPINVDFGASEDFKGVIAPFWTKLQLDNGNGLNYSLEDDQLIVQWTNLQAEGGGTINPGKVTFQVEINNEGVIKFHYMDISSWGGLLLYGLKSPDGTEIVSTDRNYLIVNWADFTNNSTMIINPPQHGAINILSDKQLNLTVSAEDIYYTGVYSDTIELHTNSAAQSLLKIPVEISVSEAPVLSVTDSLINKEVIFKEGLVLTNEISLFNQGYGVVSISNISFEGLESLTVYNEEGSKIVKSSSGDLLSPLKINPWETVVITVEYPVSQQIDVSGSIVFSGNFGTKQTVIESEIVDSPIFSWNAEDQAYELANIEKEKYTFRIENKGETSLMFNVIPATVPEASPLPSEPYISENTGNYDFNKRVTVDSLAHDVLEDGDGVFTPFAVGVNLAFSNRFVAPVGGFNLTHIKAYTYLASRDELIKLMVYVGGESPQDGQKVYEQEFVIDEKVDEEWIIFPIEKPFTIPEGQTFYVIISHPVAPKYMGIEFTKDEERLKNSFSGVYRGEDQYYWYNGYTQNEYFVWKIRALTASGKNQWLTLDTEEGTLSGGESIDVTATIDPEIAGKGAHSGKILVSSNDLNYPDDEVTITLKVNGKPEFEFYPNMYEDTLEVVETESIVFNYLFKDPENETMSISIEEGTSDLDYELVQTGPNTAQVSIDTDYESGGLHKFNIEVVDVNGNIAFDTIKLNVLEKNRPPVFNTEFEVITLNLADTNRALTINPANLFTDPDGDNLQLLAGNYNPDIVDMALGNEKITMSPLKVGTAQVVFGADDGKEGGFVLYLVYVVVIDDPDAVNGVPDGNIPEQELAKDGGIPALFYPNPVENQAAKLYYKLEQESNISIEIYDYKGQLMQRKDKYNVGVGDHIEHITFNNIAAGIYICILKTDNMPERRFKIIVR